MNEDGRQRVSLQPDWHNLAYFYLVIKGFQLKLEVCPFSKTGRENILLYFSVLRAEEHCFQKIYYSLSALV